MLATPPGSVPMGWPRRPRIGNWDGNEQAEPMRFHEPSRHVVWLPSEGYFALPYDEGAVHVACIWLGRARAARCARGAPNFFPYQVGWRVVYACSFALTNCFPLFCDLNLNSNVQMRSSSARKSKDMIRCGQLAQPARPRRCYFVAVRSAARTVQIGRAAVVLRKTSLSFRKSTRAPDVLSEFF